MKTAVKDVMTTRVIWGRKDAAFREVAAALREHRVSAFPVLNDEDKVIGVVSEADLLTKEALDGEPGVISGLLHCRDQAKARGITAGDLMTAAVVPSARTTRSSTPPSSCTTARSSGSRSPTRTATWSASSAGPTCSRSSTGPTRPSAGKSSTRSSRDFLVDPLAFDVTVKDGIVTLVRRPETSETGQEIVRREPRRPPRSVTHWCARPGTFPVWSRSATASATPTSTRSSRARCSEP